MPFVLGQVSFTSPDAAAPLRQVRPCLLLWFGKEGLRQGLAGGAASSCQACCQGELAAGPGLGVEAAVVAQLCLQCGHACHFGGGEGGLLQRLAGGAASSLQACFCGGVQLGWHKGSGFSSCSALPAVS